MSADEYTAQFKILAGRTGFNNEALKDTYAWELLAIILDKIHVQPLLPSNLKAWKEAACQIDHNYCRLLEVKRAQAPHSSNCAIPACTTTAPVTPLSQHCYTHGY